MARPGKINSKVFEIFLLQEDLNTLVALRRVNVRGVYVQLRMIPPHPRNPQRKRIRPSYINYSDPRYRIIFLCIEDIERLTKKIAIPVKSFLLRKEEHDPTVVKERRPLTDTRFKLLTATPNSLRTKHGPGYD